VRATLASARAAAGGGPDAGRDAIASLLPGIMRSQDAAEGLRSFLERREAHFTGH
jgi:enoyl-CoA hydratase/carnithine racemase